MTSLWPGYEMQCPPRLISENRVLVFLSRAWRWNHWCQPSHLLCLVWSVFRPHPTAQHSVPTGRRTRTMTIFIVFQWTTTIILWDSARYFTNISIFHTSFLRLSGSQDSPLQPSVCLKFQGSKVEYDQSESESVGSLLEIIHFSRMLVSPIDCWFMGGF